MSLPTFEQIEKWSDQQLNITINAGERINWDIKSGNETQEEVDFYVESLYMIADKRCINKSENLPQP